LAGIASDALPEIFFSKNMRYTLYFAYGSNMNAPQFRKRCPASFFLCRATLPKYRFIIMSAGYASVIPKARSVVRGTLYAITEKDERTLDRYEGVRQKEYRREWLNVVTESGVAIPALIYIAREENPGPPKDGYLEKILAGAKHHQMPKRYIAEIRGWAKKQ